MIILVIALPLAVLAAWPKRNDVDDLIAKLEEQDQA